MAVIAVLRRIRVGADRPDKYDQPANSSPAKQKVEQEDWHYVMATPRRKDCRQEVKKPEEEEMKNGCASRVLGKYAGLAKKFPSVPVLIISYSGPAQSRRNDRLAGIATNWIGRSGRDWRDTTGRCPMMNCWQRQCEPKT
jgi:hypothetical protein